MTDLLRPSTTAAARDDSARDSSGRRRPLAVAALLAGVWAPLSLLALGWVVGLVGWFASDGGEHGTPRDALRVGADAWLLAHGTPLATADATVTAAPLGLTLLAAYLAFRAARSAAAGSDADDLRSVGLGTVVLAGTYGVVALVTAVLASVPGAAPSLGWAFASGTAMGAVLGGLGLLVGSGLAGPLWWSRGPHLRAALLTAAGTVLLMLVLGAAAVAGALAFHASAAANVLTELKPDTTGGLLSVLLLAALAPNAALLACSYLLGPGFAVGVGTVVSPAEVVLGPVPAVPLLAALPSGGAGPGWAWVLLALPVVAAAVAAVLTARVLPTRSWRDAVVRALAGALLAAVLLTVLVHFAGGSIGPARMSELGAPVGEVLTAAVTTFGTGAVLGALAATWWRRRRVPEEHDDGPDQGAPTTRLDLSAEPTVRIPRPQRSRSTD